MSEELLLKFVESFLRCERYYSFCSPKLDEPVVAGVFVAQDGNQHTTIDYHSQRWVPRTGHLRVSTIPASNSRSASSIAISNALFARSRSPSSW